MGVQGLTTYIAKKSEQYLVPFELHDTNLVIDGDSLASNLYQWSPAINSAFGGDYTIYHHIVTRFFGALHKCGVRAFVLLDGGYQRRKLRTVHNRLRSKIASIRHLNPLGGNRLFPLQMRECFVHAVRSCSPTVRLMRCLYEADDEVAQLARQLRCPVLSYDSDFYIHNVLYIPTVSLTRRPLRRQAPRRNRRRPAATSRSATAAFAEYWYMDCCVYTIANLARGVVRDEVLPLFGVLLGNDYIGRHVFNKFFANVSTRNVGRRNSPQQKRIIGLLRWLRGETLASATAKVLDSVASTERGRLARDIDRAMEGYIRANSEAFTYFGLNDLDVNENELEILIVDADDTDENEDDGEGDDNELEIGNHSDQSVDSQIDSETDSEPPFENHENEPGDKVCAVGLPAEPNFLYRSCGAGVSMSNWLRRLIHEADVPRYVVDLLTLRMYINAPQVEDFQKPDSNRIAIPILRLIYTLVHLQNAQPNVEPLVYLTRDSKNPSTFVNVTLDAYETENLPEFVLDGGNSNAQLVVDVLFAQHPNLRSIIVDSISGLPDTERLFAVSLVYASVNSTGLTRAHLFALLLCVFALQRSTAIGCSYADEDHLRRQFGAHMDMDTGIKTKTKLLPPQLLEAIRLARNLLPHQQLNKAVRSRHTGFSIATVHAFAEWQAVMFHMNTLSALLGDPFGPRMPVAEFFSGTLAYNLTVTLSDRPDMRYYARQYIFKDCPRMAEEFEDIVLMLEPLVERLAMSNTANASSCESNRTQKSTRNVRKLAKKRAQRSANSGTSLEMKESIQEIPPDADIDGYDGIGNRFANLVI